MRAPQASPRLVPLSAAALALLIAVVAIFARSSWRAGPDRASPRAGSPNLERAMSFAAAERAL